MRLWLSGSAVLLWFLLCDFSVAQNVVADYVHDSPIAYHPADPWYRGRIFRAQIGHSGRFYHCDGEEFKRYSPYIYWRSEVKAGPTHPLWYTIRQQIHRIHWRHRAGAGDCHSLLSRLGEPAVVCESPFVSSPVHTIRDFGEYYVEPEYREPATMIPHSSRYSPSTPSQPQIHQPSVLESDNKWRSIPRRDSGHQPENHIGGQRPAGDYFVEPPVIHQSPQYSSPSSSSSSSSSNASRTLR